MCCSLRPTDPSHRIVPSTCFTDSSHRTRPTEPVPLNSSRYPCSWALTAIAEIFYFAHSYKESMKIFSQPAAEL